MTEDKNKEMKDYMNSQIEEINKHKWIKSEEAGYDLGEEAVKDWIDKYADDFRKTYEIEKEKKN